jgi:hypothetical membrane protein
MFKNFKYFGVASGLSGWVVILTAISRNSWFVFTENALSDLGGPLASASWIFNKGLMFTGLLIICYSFYLVSISDNKPSTVGGCFLLITGVFLVLIGVFPSGTPHHYFVSVWFFTQADLSIIATGIGLAQTVNKRYGLVFLGLGLVGPIIAYVVDWPSIAVLEVYGIIIMNIWVILMMRLDLSHNL